MIRDFNRRRESRDLRKNGRELDSRISRRGGCEETGLTERNSTR